MDATFPLKRWLVFGGKDYYARGGAWDLRGSYDTKDDAVSSIQIKPSVYDADGPAVEWAHVVDSHTGETMAFSHRHDGEPVITPRPEYYYTDPSDV